MQPERIPSTVVPYDAEVLGIVRLFNGVPMRTSCRALALRLRAAALQILAELESPTGSTINILEQDKETGNELVLGLRPIGSTNNPEVALHNPLISLFFSSLESQVVECLHKHGPCIGAKIAKLTRNLSGETMSGPIRAVLPNLIGRGVLVNTNDAGYALTDAAKDIWERFFDLGNDQEPM